MFKLLSKNEKIKEKLAIVDASDYKYLITDDELLFEDDKVNIKANVNVLDELNELIDLVMQGEELYLVVHDTRGQKRVLVDQVQYIESVGDDIYVNLMNHQFMYKGRLYQVEEVVMRKKFIRVSKSHLVNLKKIDFIKPAINSKIELIMKNGDAVEVKRTYLKDFKKALEL